jgi:hypothetical protein
LDPTVILGEREVERVKILSSCERLIKKLLNWYLRRCFEKFHV